MDPKTIAVIGAGNGGFAMAADLALSGWKISLYELPRFRENIDPLSDKGGIDIVGTNIDGKANSGFGKLNKITCDIKDAIDDAHCIMVNTRAVTHGEVAELMGPHLKEGQTIFILPGNGGSLLFTKIFREMGMKVKVDLAETLTFPYGCRKTSPTSVFVDRMLGKNLLAAFPSRNNDKLLNTFKTFYPNSSTWHHVLEIAISNPNIILHPAATMLSVARIEFSKGDFGLYTEGFSPSVMKVLESLDEESVNIKRCLGIPAISYKELYEIRHSRPFKEHWDQVLCTKNSPRGPTDVKTRYITEDVPVGMVLIASIGRLYGVPTPTFDSVIHLCGVMNDCDYWGEGRTMEKLGLSKLSLKDLKEYLKQGYFPSGSS